MTHIILADALMTLAGQHPVRIVVTDNGKDVYEGDFSRDVVLDALNRRNPVIVAFCRTEFFAVELKSDQPVDAWRSPGGQWIGDLFGLEGRNVFGNAPAPERLPKEERAEKVLPGLRTPVTVQPVKDEIARAARTGDLAAALNQGGN